MPDKISAQSDSHTVFKRELGLFDSTMIVIGSMIGSGIFIVSSDIARTVGSPGLLLVVWLVSGLITLIGALSYGELAAMMPRAGGQYVYLREAYNPLIGFLYGWTLFLVIQSGTIAAVAVAFAKFASVLIPSLGTKHILFHILGLPISAAQIVAIILIAILTFLNSRGVKQGKLVQDFFTTVKAASLIILILLGLFFGANYNAIMLNLQHFWANKWLLFEGSKILSVQNLSGFGIIAAVGTAMVGSLFSSDAWNNITFTAGEVKNPQRNIPRSLIIGTLTVTFIYIMINVVYLVVLPVVGDPAATSAFGLGIQFAAEDRVAVSTAKMVMGEGAGILMAVLIMVSTFGCNNGLILTGARVYYAMAKDKLFFNRTGHLNKNSVPGNALMYQGVWASILCLSGTYGQLLDYVIFAVLVFYILTIAGLIKLRITKPDAERPYKTFGYPFIPILYIVLAFSVCVILLIYKPLYTWPGLGIVLLGIPVYYVWKKFA